MWIGRLRERYPSLTHSRHCESTSYQPFLGYEGEDAESLIQRVNWMAYDRGRNTDEDRLRMLGMLLVGSACLWWEGILEDERDTWPQAMNVFRRRYGRPTTVEELWHTLTHTYMKE